MHPARGREGGREGSATVRRLCKAWLVQDRPLPPVRLSQRALQAGHRDKPRALGGRHRFWPGRLICGQMVDLVLPAGVQGGGGQAGAALGLRSLAWGGLQPPKPTVALARVLCQSAGGGGLCTASMAQFAQNFLQLQRLWLGT